MSERRVTGLKEVARATVLQELRVTPEMRARLERRIRRLEPAAKRRSGWWLPAGATAVAAVLLLAVGLGRWGAPEQGQPLEGAPAQIPPPAPSAGAAKAAADADLIPLSDAYGNKVVITGSNVFTAQVQDQSGKVIEGQLSAKNAPPPPSGLPGVEARPGQRIVLNADYSLEVADAHGVMASLQAMTAAAGGYVVESTLNRGEDGSWAGRLVLRIPAERFSATTARMGEYGKVTHQRQWSQDVTDQYTDLESRLVVLQEHEQKLQELALQAANFDDWLRLAKQLNETRTQVERLQGQLKQLANRVEYSTLNIGLFQPAPGQESIGKEDGLGRQMSAAFAGSIRRMSEAGREALVALAGVLPLLVPVAILLVGLLLWLRRRRGEIR
ncbi:MAG: DUF4349 domain-containing protein [Bacillota bacterium]